MTKLSRRNFVFASAVLLAAGGAQAQQRKTRVGVLRLASSAPLFLAQDKGFFKEAGLDVELVYFDAAQPIAVAAASGDIDFGVTAFTAGLLNLAGKGALSVIAGQARELPGFPLDAYLATNQPNGAALKKPADIRGKSIGITQIGSSFHYAAGLLAEKHGFPITDVKFIPLQSMSNVISALQGGRIDGALLPATAAQTAIETGAARLLGWQSDEAAWQIGSVFASAKIKADEKTIAAFLAGYKRGCKLYAQALQPKIVNGAAPVDATTEPLLAAIAKATSQPVEKIRNGLSYIEPDGKLDLANLAHQISWYQKLGFVDAGFGVKEVCDPRFVAGL